MFPTGAPLSPLALPIGATKPLSIPYRGAAAFCHNPEHLSQRVMRAVSKMQIAAGARLGDKP
jgi:hypothetical protein